MTRPQLLARVKEFLAQRWSHPWLARCWLTGSQPATGVESVAVVWDLAAALADFVAVWRDDMPNAFDELAVGVAGGSVFDKGV